MRFGYHCSISGGLTKAIDQALRLQCECMQIFSRNPRGWEARPLEAEQIDEFRKRWKDSGFHPLAVHLPYLANFGSEKEELLQKSINTLTMEMNRAHALGADYVVAHPGHVGKGQSREDAIGRVCGSIIKAMKNVNGEHEVALLLETTSGQRNELGGAFEELACMIKCIEAGLISGGSLGVCLDTAHIWGAGYDLRGIKAQDETMNEFDRIIGLDRLKFIHLNDSIVEFGARRDRHAAAGKGKIGSRNMAAFVRRPEFDKIGAIMETPFVSIEDDLVNMNRVKRWRKH